MMQVEINGTSYETVIGLEIHVQLKTDSKAFCRDVNRFGGAPNTRVSAISLGHPGTLPIPNTRQIEYAVRLGLALGCDITKNMFFDRKNYTYPDLPKGYQITQDDSPVCVGGAIDIRIKGKGKRIRLTRIHMEEDAGKLVHGVISGASGVDLNRAGTPLLEIVTEPELRSGEEAFQVLAEIRRLIRYLDISDGNMEEGSMRCDCNISLRPQGQKAFGTRCEIKNVNSMRNAWKAIEAEAARQAEVLRQGGTIDQQTRSYDVEGNHTRHILRDKEDAHDYRYFPEPDIPPLEISDEYIQKIKKNLPALPAELRTRFQKEYKLNEYDTEILIDDKETADLYLGVLNHYQGYKTVANMVINKVKAYVKENGANLTDLTPRYVQLAAYAELLDSGKVAASVANQRIFPEMMSNPSKSPAQIAEELNLIQEADTDFLSTAIDEVLAGNTDAVARFRKGKKGLMGFFMGEVMKKTKGKAHPKETQKLLAEKLNNFS